ncbi:MAG: DUF2950 domain-containing protein [Terriglobales bacterium]
MSHMHPVRLDVNRSYSASLSKIAAVAVLFTVCFSGHSFAQQHGQKTFSSAQAAASALVAAAKNNDENAMIEILGPEGKKIVSSGDDTEDANHRADFVKKYEQMHRLVTEPDGTTVLYIGAENWPTPIPIVKKGNSWYFDTAAGEKEVLYRRVGRNEMSAIRVCQELVAAEKEYSAQYKYYALKIYSDDDQHDGLYWKATEGAPQSPIGPLVALAVSEGYAEGRDNPPTPYRGYYFHVLTAQGKDAPGGAKNYVVDGKMTAGFAFVAYPAEYRSSGVMTFIVNEDGTVYQKDLGKKTDAIAKKMKEYNPAPDWQKAQNQQETAQEQAAKP